MIGLEFIDSNWWVLIWPVVGILGGGSAGTSPFSEKFSRNRSGMTAISSIPEPTTFEQQQYQQLAATGETQRGALNQAVRMGLQPQQFSANIANLNLSPQDLALLQDAYANSEANVRRFGGLLGQDLAGTRGLNTSDTPVTEAVLRETLPIIRDLNTNMAQSRLGLGLNLAQLRQSAQQFSQGLGEQSRQFNIGSLLTASQATPMANLQLAQLLQRNRFGNVSQTSTGFDQPSPLQNMKTASEIYQNVMSGTGSVMGGAAAMKSDRRLKRDITPVSWKWAHSPDREYLGVVAQEVEHSHPHLVTRNQRGELLVDYGTMVALLLDEREHLYAQLAAQ